MKPSLLILAVLALLTPAAQAQAERYAAFVADMDTGVVLHARRADALRYPASLTKMMTLYMTFEALETGDLTLETQLTASREAASRPPSELGLDSGDTITVDEAIRALIVQSANDVAVVLAESQAETESAFARAMTERALALGLRSTNFTNASGLPDRDQQTTARDMARLAHALRRDFPQYWPYFAETQFTWSGTVHRSHNTLVGRLEGVDGLKTGYIRASGFHVAATAERGDRRLVAIIMGGASPAVRDAHARELIEAGYSALEAQEEGLQLAALNSPRLNPVREQEWLTAELRGTLRSSAVGSADRIPAGGIQIVFDGPQSSRLDLERDWSIQIGAYGARDTAQARLASLIASDLTTLPDTASPATEPLRIGDSSLWRARLTGMDSETAREVCVEIVSRGEPCFTVAPGA